MAGLLVLLIYIGSIIAIVVYAFYLFTRLVRAHERTTLALETIARKLPEEGRQS